ncbi:MAG TPA: hypothetical protein VF745_17420 [Steroidobacteraceae bacterium]
MIKSPRSASRVPTWSQQLRIIPWHLQEPRIEEGLEREETEAVTVRMTDRQYNQCSSISRSTTAWL